MMYERSIWRRETLLFAVCLLLAALFYNVSAGAAEPGLGLSLEWPNDKNNSIAGPLRIVALLTVLALLPAIVIAMTSFTRTIIVLSMLRHAFGMQDTPPNIVLLSVALFLTLFTMAPAMEEINTNSLQPFSQQKVDLPTAINNGIAPLRNFMVRQTREKDLALMLEYISTTHIHGFSHFIFLVCAGFSFSSMKQRVVDESNIHSHVT